MRRVVWVMVLATLMALPAAGADEDEASLTIPNQVKHPCYLYSGPGSVEFWVESNGIRGLQRHHADRPDDQHEAHEFVVACFGNEASDVAEHVLECLPRLLRSLPADPSEPWAGLDVCYIGSLQPPQALPISEWPPTIPI